MTSSALSLDKPENIQHFVKVISRFPRCMDLRSGKRIVDAHSILGIFSLNLNAPVELQVDEAALGAAELAELQQEILPFRPVQA